MILAGLVAIWLIGILLARFLLPVASRSPVDLVLQLSLGAGLGIGIASSLYFLCLVAPGPGVAILASVEIAALLGVAILAVLARRRVLTFGWADGPSTPAYLTGLFIAAAALAAVVFIIQTLFKPHGDWNAWALLNLRARFLFRSGPDWPRTFSNLIPWSHPDYPLLIPGAVAMLWTFARHESTLAPIGVAFLFTLATAALLVSALGVLRGKLAAWLAGIVLLGSIAFVQTGAMQYADVPLSFYILAPLVVLCLQDRYPENPRFSIAAGLMAGFASWTENQGLLLVAAVLIARVIAVLRFGTRAALARQLFRFIFGLAGPLALVGIFKLRYAPASDFMAATPGQALAHLADPARWITVISGFLRSAFLMGTFLVPLILVLALYWYLVRIQVGQQHRLRVATSALTLVFLLAGELGMLILYPADLAVQVNASMDRNLLQLFPAALFVFFLAAQVPQLAGEPSKPARPAVKSRAKSA